ncbi:MAG: transposase [Ruminococcaceae bacterium]|nr:transposase [Oscillospiraceae bacterium]
MRGYMNIVELEKKFGTEEQCRQYISSIRWKDGYRCPLCQSSEAWVTSEYKYKCQKCGHKLSVTSGTIFQDTHIPLPDWFKAIWYASAQENKLTVAFLQKELNLKSNRTALSMINKLDRIMIRPILHRLHGNIEIITTDIRVKNQYLHFAIAVEVNNNRIGRIRIKQINRDNQSDIVEFVNSCTGSNSNLIHRFSFLTDIHFEKEHTHIIKSPQYTFRKIQKVRDQFEHWLIDHYVEGKMTRCINHFCATVNCPKSKADFYELLEHAVNLKPISSKK